MDLGALLEPLGVAIHAYRRSLMKEGMTALVFGAGAVGLLAAAVAKTKGAKTVLIADIDAGRVDFAVKNGFAHAGFTVPMKRGKDTDENLAIARETAEALGKLDNVGEVDVVFECTGVPACVQAGIYVSFPLPVLSSSKAPFSDFDSRQQSLVADSCSSAWASQSKLSLSPPLPSEKSISSASSDTPIPTPKELR